MKTRQLSFEQAAFALYCLVTVSPDIFPGAARLDLDPGLTPEQLCARDADGSYTFPGVQDLYLAWDYSVVAETSRACADLARVAGGRQPGLWEVRAMEFVQALIVFMAQRGEAITAASINRYRDLPTLVRAVRETRPADPAYEAVLRPLLHYLAELPGYSGDGAAEEQTAPAFEHAFITMALKRAEPTEVSRVS